MVWCGVVGWDWIYSTQLYSTALCSIHSKRSTIFTSTFLLLLLHFSIHRESHDAQRLASAPVTNNSTLPSRSITKYFESPAPPIIIKIPVYPKKKSKWIPKNKTVNDQICVSDSAVLFPFRLLCPSFYEATLDSIPCLHPCITHSISISILPSLSYPPSLPLFLPSSFPLSLSSSLPPSFPYFLPHSLNLFFPSNMYT